MTKSDLKCSVCMSDLDKGVTQADIACMCRRVGKVVKSALVLGADEKWTGIAYVMFDDEVETLAAALHQSKGSVKVQGISDERIEFEALLEDEGDVDSVD